MLSYLPTSARYLIFNAICANSVARCAACRRIDDSFRSRRRCCARGSGRCHETTVNVHERNADTDFAINILTRRASYIQIHNTNLKIAKRNKQTTHTSAWRNGVDRFWNARRYVCSNRLTVTRHIILFFYS